MLNDRGIKANAVDSRNLLKTDANFGSARINMAVSKKNVNDYFMGHNGQSVQVVTGFIASSENNETTTLGRNGSNYSAALLANFIDSEELFIDFVSCFGAQDSAGQNK